MAASRCRSDVVEEEIRRQAMRKALEESRTNEEQLVESMKKVSQEIHDNTIIDGEKVKTRKARDGAPRRKPSSLPKQAKAFPRKLTGTRVMSMRHKSPPRNKPCPCGSGRKYKKCCGAPERVRPKVQAVRAMPGQIVRPPQDGGLAPDGLPLVATPRDLDPMGDKDIVTAEDIEREHEALVNRTMKEAEGEPEGKIILATK